MARQKKVLARDSIIRGAGRMIDPTGGIKNREVVHRRPSDAQAMKSDWVVVGKDISNSMQKQREVVINSDDG